MTLERSKMSIPFVKKCAVVCVLLLGYQAAQALSSKSRNDYFPLYTTLEPHAYLYTRTKEQLHGRNENEDEEKLNKFSFSISPFAQNADIGKNINDKDSELGSLNAPWSMLGLLMGAIPEGKSLPGTLTTARATLFPTVAPTQQLEAETVIDRTEKFGFFEFPATYRKRGIRCELSVGLTDDLGFSVQAGASDINFTVTEFKDLTSGSSISAPDYPNVTEANVNNVLMNNLQNIANDLELNLCNFHKSAVEDIRFNLFWRHAFEINKDEKGWPQFLFIPFLSFGASIAAGKEMDPCDAFDLPFGNNGHNSIGFQAGINLDFTKTIEIGAEIGVTHFFENQFNNFPVPTSKLQSGIFPFKTSVDIDPGHNWHFGMKLNAHHFLDKLSFYFQWVILEHKNDKICLQSADCAFKPEVLECRSNWKAQVVNTALNYDISPNISLGFLWQAPVSQRNVFRSTTAMFGLNVTF